MANKTGKIYNANWINVRQKFINNVWKVYRERVMPLQMLSRDVADLFPVYSFDFIFIDANHGYKYVKGDIQNWWLKLKIGGLMCGDDYVDKPTYGVIRAVTESFRGGHKTTGPIWYIERREGICPE